ncbi:MAG: T9SS type A sorting domain-containing protein [Bacteroidia bacterium]|jgi:photosystem II stability/assembly factor-like uncharacterized protein|nr:T9SS type A sorting domain-containing protein [Bacteroidia bacterium]
MKKIGAVLLGVLAVLNLPAQDFRRQIGVNEGDNFAQICAKADAFWTRPGPVAAQNNAPPFTDNAYHAYQRWKWYWHTRLDENGNFPDVVAAQAEADALRSNQRMSVNPSWNFISQTVCDGGYNGMGRTTCIAFHPTNANTFYVGAPIGGLWKTTDGGQTYTPLTDALPYVSVGSCLVDPVNPNNIYISVGDHQGWWNYSLGIYKSTDGGATWNTTGLSWQLSQGRAISGMVMDPNNAQIIYAATSNGLYKTVNGGANWTVVRAGYYSDVEIEPGTSNVYAALHDYWGSSEVFRSTDGGSTWTQLSNFGQNYNWIRIAVTPANTAMLAVQCSTGNNPLYISYNYGANLNYVSDCPEDDILLISPNNASIIYCGFVYVYQSTDGGVNWNMKSYWYYNPPYPEVHADQRNVAFHPLNPDMIYFCNDGGVYSYSESGNTFTELTDGLLITQFYKIAQSPTNAQLIIGGTQDNGGRLRMNNGQWRATNGGDAMEVAIDPVNNNTIYTTYINGMLYRSNDQWTNDTYNEISANIPGGTPTGSWVTPYMLDPSDRLTLIAGYDEVWMTNDQGNTWTAISSNIANGNTLECLMIAASDPNTIYVSQGSTLYKTTNRGVSWSTVSVPGTAPITSITIHPTNAQKVWITRGNYVSTSKVFHSVNGGANWLNWSTGLPNVPVNALVYQQGPGGVVYAGTDAGVFMRDTISNTWQPWGTGLPKTSVTDLEIFYPTMKLRAGTYGRGIWEIDLSTPLGISQPWAEAATFTLYPNPGNGLVTVSLPQENQSGAAISVINAQGELVFATQAAAGVQRNTIDLSTLPRGMYMVQVQQQDQLSVQKLILY